MAGIVANDLKQVPASPNVNKEVAAWAQPFNYGPFVHRLQVELGK